MQIITATEFARNFRSVLDRIVIHHQSLVIRRNNQDIACIVPSPATMDALEALGDLYQTLPAQAADCWLDTRTDNTIDSVDRSASN